jgi:hypothetical protein
MLAAATMAGGILLAILLIVLTFGRFRKEAATEVASKEAYLAEAQRLSHTGSFGWRAASGFVWSEETFRIFELDRAIAPTVAAVIQRTHPEDRERVQQFIDRASRDGARSRCANDHSRRADGMDRARSEPAARGHCHQWNGLSAMARPGDPGFG